MKTKGILVTIFGMKSLATTLLLIIYANCFGVIHSIDKMYSPNLKSALIKMDFSEMKEAIEFDYSSVNRLIPSVNELVVDARKKTQQLDSISEIKLYPTYIEECKKYFFYEDGHLKKSQFQVGIKGKDIYKEEFRQYNSDEQIVDFQKFETMIGYKTAKVLTEREEFLYDKGRLIEYNHHIIDKFYPKDKTENGVFYTGGSATYKSTIKYYEYNDQKHTLKLSGSKNKNFSIQYFNEDGTINVEYFYVYFAGQTDSILDQTVEYIYSKTDTSRHIIREHKRFDDYYSSGYFRTFNYIDFLLDEKGRDSVYFHVYQQEPMENVWLLVTRIEYSYLDNDLLSHAKVFVQRNEYTKDDLYELGQFVFTYDSNSLISTINQSFYDDRTQKRVTAEENTYFYSPIATTKADQPKGNNELVVFPNPASDHIAIQLKTSTKAHYQIYDLYGRQMLSGKILNKTIDVSALPIGTYLVKVNDGKSIRVKTVIKK